MPLIKLINIPAKAAIPKLKRVPTKTYSLFWVALCDIKFFDRVLANVIISFEFYKIFF